MSTIMNGDLFRFHSWKFLWFVHLELHSKKLIHSAHEHNNHMMCSVITHPRNGIVIVVEVTIMPQYLFCSFKFLFQVVFFLNGIVIQTDWMSIQKFNLLSVTSHFQKPGFSVHCLGRSLTGERYVPYVFFSTNSNTGTVLTPEILSFWRLTPFNSHSLSVNLAS